jgi:beta-mannosidase
VVSWAAVDFAGHRKPLWHALRDAYAPRLATLQPRPSEESRANAWEGLKPEFDLLALVLVNDTGEAYSGSFTVTRESFDGKVLAKAVVEGRVDARDGATVAVPAEVATFGDPNAEFIRAEGDGFAPAFYYGAEVIDQDLDPRPFEVATETVDGGCVLHVTAHSLVRDLFCHADKVDPAARAEQGMLTLRAGESARIRVVSPSGDPAAFAAVLRCANDLV